MSEQGRIERLEAAVAADPATAGFAELAELHRRAGRATDAEQVARRGLERKPGHLEGALALALALLDQNRVVEARQALERAAAGVFALESAAAGAPASGFGEELSDAELDSAFAVAETDRDEVIDADRIAQEALRDADRALVEELSTSPDASFATHTLADLFERQGDPDAASRVRAAVGARTGSSRERVVQTLERWLENLRRNER